MTKKTFLLPSADNDEMNLEAVLIQLQQDVTECENYLVQQQKQLHKKALEQQMNENIKNMTAIGERINSLATQLEVEILCLTKVALHINKQAVNMTKMGCEQHTRFDSKSSNILEINFSAIPKLINNDSRFILKSKSIDFLQTECQQRDNCMNQVTKSPLQKRQSLEKWLMAQKE